MNCPYSAYLGFPSLQSSIDMKYRSKILLLPLLVLFQAACSNQAAYTGESFSSDSPFKLKVDGEVATACESVRRSLLGQGYLIDLASSEEVKARKATRGEGKQNSFIEMNAVCVSEGSGSTIFATGVLSTYAMKMSSSSASVGVSAIGSISLPIGQSVDSLVKVSEETIDDKDFYKRFFSAVSIILGEMEASKSAMELVAEPADAESESAPLVQPAIWPELFPESAETDGEPAPTPPLAEPEIVPERIPADVGPALVPEVFPAGTEPANAPGSLPVESVPVNTSAPVPNEQFIGVTPGPLPDEEPLGILPAPLPDEEPLGIPPEPLSVQKTPNTTSKTPPPATIEELF